MTSHIYRSASLIAVSAALAANPALAANLNWNGTTVDWGDGTNWGGTAPTSIDNVRITEQGNDPVLDGTVGVAGTINISSNAGNGSAVEPLLTLRNGATMTSGSTVLGLSVDQQGAANVSGATTRWTSTDFNIGNGGSGTLTLFDSATINTGSLAIGGTSGASGIVTVATLGKLSASATIFVGSGGAGSLHVSGGGKIVSDNASVGTNAGASGIVTLTGTGTSWTMTRNLSLGNASTGTLDVSAGAGIQAGGFLLGGAATGTGTMTIDGAGSFVTATSATNTMIIGDSGRGTLTLANGGKLVAVNGTGVPRIAQRVGSIGVLNIGAAQGVAAVGAGTVEAASVLFGLGTGTLAFNHTDTDYAFNAAILGKGSVVLSAGVTRFTKASSYTGTTTISGGILEAGMATSLGTSAVTLGTAGVNLATLRFGANMTLANNINLASDNARLDTAGRDVILSGNLSGSDGLFKLGAGTLRLTGTNAYNGTTTLAAGNLAGSANSFGTGMVSTAGGTTLILDQAGSATFGNQIVGDGALVKQGSGTLTLNGANGFTGGTTVAQGKLAIEATGALGTGALRIETGASADFAANSSVGDRAINNNGALAFLGSSDGGQARVTNNAGASVTIAGLTSGDASIGSLSGAGNIVLGDKILTLGALGSNDVLSGVLSGNGGSLIKTGAGVLTLSGTSDFTGGTTVNAGQLRVDGSTISDTHVAAGAALAGTGRIGGEVKIADGGTLLGQTGQALTMDSLTLSANSIVDVTIGAPAQSALFDVDGALILDGTLAIRDSLGFAPGITRLFDYGGALTDNGLDIGGVPIGAEATDFAVQTAVAGQVNLINTGGLALSHWDGNEAGSANNGQVDGGAGVWSLTSENWTDTNGIVTHAMQPQPGFAVFAGTSGTVTVDNSAGAVATSGMQFATDGYRIDGAALTVDAADTIIRVGDGTAAGIAMMATIDAELSGAGGIRKTDLGALILGADNSYAGGTSILDGTLIGEASSFGSGDIANDARLVIRQASGGVLTNSLSGSGIIEKTGAGTLTLSGNGAAFTGTTAINEGQVILTGSLAGTVDVASQTILRVGNGGTSGDLQAEVRSEGTVVFDRSDSFAHNSALSGTGALVKRGAGTLTLSGDYDYSGSTTVEAGILRLGTALDSATDLIVNNGIFDLGAVTQQVASLSGSGGNILLGSGARLTVNQASQTAFSGALSGSGTFVKAGAGALDLTGTSNFTGQLLVNQGRLAVNGTLPGNAVVNSGGILSGAGTLGRLSVLSGGILAPGNSIGTLNVTGPVSFAAGSIFEVEANPVIGVDGFGQSDRLVVTGTAALQGGTVRVLAADGIYAPFTSYRILSASGGVTGTFAGVTDNLAYLDSALRYDPKNVYLELLRNNVDFAAIVTSANQKATANAIEGLAFDNPVYRAAIVLTEDSAAAAYDQLSGEIHASARSALAEEARFARGAALARLDAEPQSGHGLWMQALGSWGTSDGDRNAAAVDRDTTSFLVGLDTGLSPNWTLGIAGGRTKTELVSHAGNGELQSTQLLAYTGAQFGRLRIKMGAGYAITDLDIRRGVTLPSLTDSLTARYDGSVLQGFGEIGFALPLGDGTVEPFANIAATRVKTDGFTEAGGAARLAIAKSSDTTTSSTLGLKLSLPKAGAFSLHALGGWQHGFGSLTPFSTTVLGGGSAFTISGAPLSRNAGVAEVEARIQLAPRVNLSAAYKGMLGSASQDHMVSGRLSIAF